MAKVIREGETEASGFNTDLSALRGLGINIGGQSTGLTADAYPDIVASREVALAVVRDSFYFSDISKYMTFVEYVNLPGGWLSELSRVLKRNIIGLPKAINRLDKSNPPAQASTTQSSLIPTEEEERAMSEVGDLVSTSIDRETGLMTLKTTTTDPVLSAELTRTYLEQLTDRVRTIRTVKSKRNLEFIQARFEEAETELMRAEEELARFLDRNNNPQTAELRTELERLQRKVSFKSQLYGDLQRQVTQAEIELQRSAPVVTVLEEPVAPRSPSGPNRMLTLLLGVVLGTFLGFSLAFAANSIQEHRNNNTSSEKLREVEKAFVPRWLQRRILEKRTHSEAEEIGSTSI